MKIEDITKTELLELYEKFKTQEAVARYLRVHTSKVRNKLYSLNIKIHKSNAAKKEEELSELTREKLLSKYKELGTLTSVAKYFGTSHKRMSKIFKQFNIQFEINKYRKYEVNELFFKEINHVSAYWLGFICADGSIHKDRLSITLASKDKTHLEKFVKDIGYTGQIKNRIHQGGRIINGKVLKTTKSSTVRINSKQLVMDLKKYMDHKKTYTLDFPHLENKYISSFCRGYFDGDGSWHIRNNGQIQFSVCGTEKFIKAFNDHMKQNTQIVSCGKNVYQQGVVCVLKYGGRLQGIEIAKWLYENDGPALERKRSIIQHYLNEHAI